MANTVCTSFQPHAWKKDSCNNCMKARTSHPQFKTPSSVKTRGQKPDENLTEQGTTGQATVVGDSTRKNGPDERPVESGQNDNGSKLREQSQTTVKSRTAKSGQTMASNSRATSGKPAIASKPRNSNMSTKVQTTTSAHKGAVPHKNKDTPNTADRRKRDAGEANVGGTCKRDIQDSVTKSTLGKQNKCLSRPQAPPPVAPDVRVKPRCDTSGEKLTEPPKPSIKQTGSTRKLPKGQVSLELSGSSKTSKMEDTTSNLETTAAPDSSPSHYYHTYDVAASLNRKVTKPTDKKPARVKQNLVPAYRVVDISKQPHTEPYNVADVTTRGNQSVPPGLPTSLPPSNKEDSFKEGTDGVEEKRFLSHQKIKAHPLSGSTGSIKYDCPPEPKMPFILQEEAAKMREQSRSPPPGRKVPIMIPSREDTDPGHTYEPIEEPSRPVDVLASQTDTDNATTSNPSTSHSKNKPSKSNVLESKMSALANLDLLKGIAGRFTSDVKADATSASVDNVSVTIAESAVSNTCSSSVESKTLDFPKKKGGKHFLRRLLKIGSCDNTLSMTDGQSGTYDPMVDASTVSHSETDRHSVVLAGATAPSPWTRNPLIRQSVPLGDAQVDSEQDLDAETTQRTVAPDIFRELQHPTSSVTPDTQSEEHPDATENQLIKKKDNVEVPSPKHEEKINNIRQAEEMARSLGIDKVSPRKKTASVTPTPASCPAPTTRPKPTKPRPSNHQSVDFHTGSERPKPKPSQTHQKQVVPLNSSQSLDTTTSHSRSKRLEGNSHSNNFATTVSTDRIQSKPDESHQQEHRNIMSVSMIDSNLTDKRASTQLMNNSTHSLPELNVDEDQSSVNTRDTEAHTGMHGDTATESTTTRPRKPSFGDNKSSCTGNTLGKATRARMTAPPPPPPVESTVLDNKRSSKSLPSDNVCALTTVPVSTATSEQTLKKSRTMKRPGCGLKSTDISAPILTNSSQIIPRSISCPEEKANEKDCDQTASTSGKTSKFLNRALPPTPGDTFFSGRSKSSSSLLSRSIEENDYELMSIDGEPDERTRRALIRPTYEDIDDGEEEGDEDQVPREDVYSDPMELLGTTCAALREQSSSSSSSDRSLSNTRGDEYLEPVSGSGDEDKPAPLPRILGESLLTPRRAQPTTTDLMTYVNKPHILHYNKSALTIEEGFSQMSLKNVDTLASRAWKIKAQFLPERSEFSTDLKWSDFSLSSHRPVIEIEDLAIFGMRNARVKPFDGYLMISRQGLSQSILEWRCPSMAVPSVMFNDKVSTDFYPKASHCDPSHYHMATQQQTNVAVLGYSSVSSLWEWISSLDYLFTSDLDEYERKACLWTSQIISAVLDLSEKWPHLGDVCPDHVVVVAMASCSQSYPILVVPDAVSCVSVTNGAGAAGSVSTPDWPTIQLGIVNCLYAILRLETTSASIPFRTKYSRGIQQFVRELSKPPGETPPHALFLGKFLLETMLWGPGAEIFRPLSAADSPEQAFNVWLDLQRCAAVNELASGEFHNTPEFANMLWYWCCASGKLLSDAARLLYA